MSQLYVQLFVDLSHMVYLSMFDDVLQMGVVDGFGKVIPRGEKNHSYPSVGKFIVPFCVSSMDFEKSLSGCRLWSQLGIHGGVLCARIGRKYSLPNSERQQHPNDELTIAMSRCTSRLFLIKTNTASIWYDCRPVLLLTPP